MKITQRSALEETLYDLTYVKREISHQNRENCLFFQEIFKSVIENGVFYPEECAGTMYIVLNIYSRLSKSFIKFYFYNNGDIIASFVVDNGVRFFKVKNLIDAQNYYHINGIITSINKKIAEDEKNTYKNHMSGR